MSERAAPMILEHYSARPLGKLRDTADMQPLSDGMKPVGLWLSVPGEDDWPSWCAREDFHLDRMAHVARFRLAADHNVLIVSTVEALDSFHHEFSAAMSLPGKSWWIEWRAVAARWDGIIIAPYQWSRRLEGPGRWYYGWDCASGCIWRPRALKRLAGVRFESGAHV